MRGEPLPEKTCFFGSVWLVVRFRLIPVIQGF